MLQNRLFSTMCTIDRNRLFGFARFPQKQHNSSHPASCSLNELPWYLLISWLIWRFDLWILKRLEREVRGAWGFPHECFHSFQNDKIIPPGDRPDRPDRPGPSGPSPGGSSATYSPVGHLGQKWPLTVWKDHCLFQRKIMRCFIQNIENTLKHISKKVWIETKIWKQVLKKKMRNSWIFRIVRWIFLLFLALKAFEVNSPLDLRWRLSRLSISRQVMTSPNIAIVRDSEMRFHKCRGDAVEDS